MVRRPPADDTPDRGPSLPFFFSWCNALGRLPSNPWISECAALGQPLTVQTTGTQCGEDGRCHVHHAFLLWRFAWPFYTSVRAGDRFVQDRNDKQWREDT